MKEKDALNRRSRFHRTPSDRPILLTPRDLEIFKVLDRYRHLRSSHFHALLDSKSRPRFIERLGRLFHGCYTCNHSSDREHTSTCSAVWYLERPEEQTQCINARYTPAVYELSEMGEQFLREHGGANSASVLLHRGRGKGRLFQHELMIGDILSSLEIGIKARPELSFISWQQILERAPADTRNAEAPFKIPVSIMYEFKNGRKSIVERYHQPLEPDSLFGIARPNVAPRFYALEADRANEPVRRTTLKNTNWLRKLLQYLEIMRSQSFTYDGHATRMSGYQHHFHIPNMTLLVVTTSEVQMRDIMELLLELTQGKGHQHILFRTMPSLASLEVAPPPTPFILDTAWQRAGHPPIFIDH